MIMKKLILQKLLLIPFFLAIIFLTSCEEKKQVKIGFLIDSFETARWQKDKKYFEDKIKELGGEVITKSAQGDADLQYKQALELIDMGIDVLVIVATNTNSAAAIVRKAKSNNVKVIAYARMISNADLDYYISFNVEKIGELQAKYVIERKPKGNFVLINGDKSDINAIKEYNGVKRIIEPLIQNKNVDIVFSCFIDSWNPEDAAYYAKKVLELSDKPIDAFIVANDGMASPIAEVLRNNQLLDKTMITGLDADINACSRILKGEQSMTVFMSIKNIATTSAELAMKIAKNQTIEYKLLQVSNGRGNVPSIILDPIIVDKNNIETTVVAEAYHTMDEILAVK
jgi:D-xylose transport system substrate-binding protein